VLGATSTTSASSSTWAAAPVDARRAPLVMELEGETHHRRAHRHRLPAHRHREEPRVPQLGAGRHLRDAHGLPVADLQRDGYSLGVEKLLGIEAPPRAQVIRVLCMELNRISSHLVAFATGGLELGA
jgi:hypothetical protein